MPLVRPLQFLRLSQLIEQRFRRLQIGGIKPLSEPVINRREDISGLSGFTLGVPYRKYIITVRRIISGELLKYRNGFRVAGDNGTRLSGSSRFSLIMPPKQSECPSTKKSQIYMGCRSNVAGGMNIH
jgi:hypothetical protein